LLHEEKAQLFNFFNKATAIIRQKPQHLTAKQYTEELAITLQEKDEDSEKKVMFIDNVYYCCNESYYSLGIYMK
jgi:hypothetical protein